ncbi:MAG: transcription antitermination factor NusB [Chloroflexi bacterium]|nr:MAG: transcription antitermination factor NusB [Chloroflexota bacterium]
MPGGSRRRSRIAALQTLFEAESADRDVLTTLDRHIEDARLPEDAAEFAQHLVEGVQKYRQAIDAVIRERAPAFPLEEMAPVDRNVLRLAIYEVLFDNQPAPLRTAINEAVELAKGYGSESSGRFVNGVLGAVALAAVDDEPPSADTSD